MKIKKNIAISESGFVFDTTSGDSYSMNPIAVEIAEMLKQNKKDNEIKKAIVQKYDVDETTFEKDYYEYLGMLKLNNFIENDEKE